MYKHTFSIVLVVFSLVLNQACREKTGHKPKEVAYNNKVTAFTSGVISNQSPIQIQFSEKVPGIVDGQDADSDLVEFQPKLKGELEWLDAQTLVFAPSETLPSGTDYQVVVDLPEIFNREKDVFQFSFSTITQNYRVDHQGMEADAEDDLTMNTYRGRIILADYADNDEVENLLKASQNNQALEIEWVHQNSEKRHDFAIKGVTRAVKESQLLLEYNAKALGLEKSDKEEIAIPSLNDFKVLDARVVMQPEQYVLVVFSDPLDPKQNINGLISISGGGNLRYVIERNRVKVYPSIRLTGTHKVTITEGIRNVLGYIQSEELDYDMEFATPKPNFKFIGKGNILPSTNGLIFPFKAVSLKSVQVRIIKIFENNIAHFLQVNRLGGDYQLRRAGRLVHKQTIRLDNDRSLNLNQWNTFSLNLSELISPEQGAIYRVELKMRQSDGLYPCENEIEEEEQVEVEGISESDVAYWDQPEAYYSSYWDGYDNYGYNWRDRDDPCTPSYYNNRVIGRNILASDIGIIAKQGNDKEVVVAVTDIRSTQPLSNVEVVIYNYQNQVAGKAMTDQEGLARIPVSMKPYLLVAKNDQQRGYLRLDDGSSLSLSRFDVGGQVVQHGMKGFIYGERGVWRPGDTVFVSFMLENKGLVLPDEHPLVFEWINPQGQTINRQVASLNDGNLYVFKTSTSADAPTGMWRARIKVGGNTFEKGMRIETIKPNRLKIKLDFDEELLKPGQSMLSKMQVNWLHGAVAKNLKADVKVTLNQAKTTFDRYTDYCFDDPSRNFYSEENTIFEGKLDEKGMAEIDASIDVKEAAPGMLKASFLTRVFEEGGDFSVDRFVKPYAPYPVFIGVKTPKGDKRGMLLTDTTHVIDVVTLNPSGEPMSVRNLSYYVYKVSWRWWWETSADNLANYVGTRHQNLISSGKVHTTHGNGQIKFKIKYPDWGRYLIRVVDSRNGHATGKTVYVDWPGWAGKSRGDDPSSASMLTFNLEKEKFQVGEKATVSFPASGEGRALVSVENGNKVINSWWVEPKSGENKFQFEVTPEMTPNAYVHITLLQPHTQSVNDLPIRMYGITLLMAEDPESHLNPIIEMPDELRPEKEVSIDVSEKEGKAMHYTLAVVEDGLLDLTRFKTPKPWYHFYAREALGVKTWDLYDQVIGAYGGKIEQIFSIGGDGDLAGKKGGKKANRFKPMVCFMGPYKLEKGETQTHTFTMPRYIGSVRTMVVASEGHAYGEAEKTTPVRNPLMVLATLPRVLGPKETVDLTVTVFAMKDNVKDVSINLETNELFEVIEGNQQKIHFDETGEKTINFKLKVKPGVGIGKVKVFAKAGGETAKDEIELEVRNPNPRIIKVESAIAEKGQIIEIPYQLPGIEGTNKAVLEVSVLPPFDFGKRLKYLMRYPHGCVEQTTSAAFPQLFLGDVMDNSFVEKNHMAKNVNAAIQRLSTFMQPDGGLGYWPGSYSSSDWGTSYAGHFMLEAEAKGYSLPIGFKRKWVKYQKRQARQWTKQRDRWGRELAQAYRLYTLALAGEPELSAMNRMRNQSNLSVQTTWRLAAAYALAGHAKVAQELTNGVAKQSVGDSGNNYTYGSKERDLAMVMEALVLMNRRKEAADLLPILSKEMSADKWMSTQTTAYCLLAVSKFIGPEGTSKNVSFEWFNKEGKQKVSTQHSIWQKNLDVSEIQSNIKLENNSDGTLYTRVILEGIPAEDDASVLNNHLQMDVRYETLGGKAIEIDQLQQGEDFKAIISIKNLGTLGEVENLALSQIFPSGWEIRNVRMEEGQSAHELSQPDYRDFRDDRVYTYFGLKRGEKKQFAIVLNASYTGQFYLPAVSCEAMYDNRISARQPGKWINVVKNTE